MGNSTISDELIKQSAIALEKSIEDGMSKIRVPGCSFVVVRSNKVIHTKSFGKANENTPVDNATIFPLSSLTKNVTSIIAGALVDEGIIKFDDKVRQYLPDFFIGNEDISSRFTIRDLISHRSGFTHFLGDSLWSAGYTKQQMVNSLKYIKNISGFRKKYGYQNIIFGIIEDVFESATKQTYNQLLNKYVGSKFPKNTISADPLITKKSFIDHFKYDYKTYGFIHALKNMFNYSSQKVVTNYSIYENKLIDLPMNDYFQRVNATAGVSMSSNDLGMWIQMLLNRGEFGGKKIVSEKVFDELTSKQVEITGLKDDDIVFPKNRLKNSYYGMGIFSSNYIDENHKDGKRIFFHMGGVHGANTFFAYCPQEDVAIAIVCNLGGSATTIFTELMTWQFLDKCFGYKDYNWTQLELDFKKKNNEMKDSYHKELLEQNPAPHEKLEKYCGKYTSKVYGKVLVQLSGNDLILHNNDIKHTTLRHVNANIFEFYTPDIFEQFTDNKSYVAFFQDDLKAFNSLRISNFHDSESDFIKEK